MNQLPLFEPSLTELLIDAMARIAVREIKDMAEHARRSIGQRTRLDHFQRRIARLRPSRATRQSPQ